MRKFCNGLISVLLVVIGVSAPAEARDWPGFSRGMGIGGWLTNYKRFNVLPEGRRLEITIGDLEHFDSYITETDIAGAGGREKERGNRRKIQ